MEEPSTTMYTLTETNTTFNNNTAIQLSGGAIYNTELATITNINCTFNNNNAQ